MELRCVRVLATAQGPWAQAPLGQGRNELARRSQRHLRTATGPIFLTPDSIRTTT